MLVNIYPSEFICHRSKQLFVRFVVMNNLLHQIVNSSDYFGDIYFLFYIFILLRPYLTILALIQVQQ